MENYLKAKKTDDHERFLGSADKLNQIHGELGTYKDGCAQAL